MLNSLKLSLTTPSCRTIVEMDKGIDNQGGTFVGYGSTHPLSQEDSPEGHAKNRRVEFVIE